LLPQSPTQPIPEVSQWAEISGMQVFYSEDVPICHPTISIKVLQEALQPQTIAWPHQFFTHNQTLDISGVDHLMPALNSSNNQIVCSCLELLSRTKNNALVPATAQSQLCCLHIYKFFSSNLLPLNFNAL